MLGAQELVLQLRHFAFRSVEGGAQAIAHAQISRGTVHFRPAAELAIERLAQVRGGHAELLEQRTRNAFALVQQRHQEMFVTNFLVVVLAGNVLRRLQRFLHLLGKLIDSHVWVKTGDAELDSRLWKMLTYLCHAGKFPPCIAPPSGSMNTCSFASKNTRSSGESA
jgi:hypothetical protein